MAPPPGSGAPSPTPTPTDKKVGLIGLGAGTLAVYGRPGDIYRFYEINPQVIELAQSEFSFMRDSQAAVETVLGDARLSLEREPPQGFDVLAVDAFSGDSVPVHLITAEAMDLYLRHLDADGIIAFHLTNRFLWLPPVVDEIARAKGLATVLIHDDAEGTRPAPHGLDAGGPQPGGAGAGRASARRSPQLARVPGLRPWTDDFNNLFQVLK